MRILFLAQDLPSSRAPERGRFIANHLEILRLDHDVTAVRLDTAMAARVRAGLGEDSPSSRDDGAGQIRWQVEGPPVARDWAAARSLRDLARRHQVIHTNALETARIGWALHRATGLPWVHTEHSSEWCVPTARGPAAALTYLSRRAVRSAAITTAVSRYLAEAMEAQTGVMPRVVPNVIDIPEPVRGPAKPDAPIRIVTSASFVAYKDPLLALHAVAQLRRHTTREITWTWIGGGPLTEPFRGEAMRLGLADMIRVIPTMEPPEYFDELRSADLFFLPSRFETFCVAGAEALGVGIPVVLGPRGGHREYADDEVGSIAQEQSVPAYVLALESVIARLGAFDPKVLHSRVKPFSCNAVRAALTDVYFSAPLGPATSPP